MRRDAGGLTWRSPVLPFLFTCTQRLSELWAFAVRTRLDLGEFPKQCPRAAIKIRQDRNMLCRQPQTTAALLCGTHPVVSDEMVSGMVLVPCE